MGTADGEVLVDGRVIYTATDLKVGLFGTPLHSDADCRVTRHKMALGKKAKPPLCGGFLLKRQNQAMTALSSMASRQPPIHSDL